MKRHPIWKVSVTASAESEDLVAELLSAAFDGSAYIYTDAESGAVTVSVYCDKRPTGLAARRTTLRDGLRNIACHGLDVGTGRISVRRIAHENWAESWKRHFKPLVIGDALLIKPSWSKRKPRRGQVVVVLDPGLSFGTGQHPTTEFCLRELVASGVPPDVEGGILPPGKTARTTRDSQKLQRPLAHARLFRRAGRPGSTAGGTPTATKRPSFLDIGTGSGILAIAAAKLGYAPIHAFDFDPQCIRVARANARANQVQRRIRITRADLTRLPQRAARQYDVICANLLANLLIAERGRILARLKPEGILVVAGILKREFSEVIAAYQAVGMKLIASKAQKEWCSGTFKRQYCAGGLPRPE